MKKINVENMSSSNGNAVANQFIIYDGKNTYFQSYNTIIAMYPNYDNTKIKLDKNSWNYSVTTGKYRNQFLGEKIAETRKKIKSGEYKLVNLN